MLLFTTKDEPFLCAAIMALISTPLPFSISPSGANKNAPSTALALRASLKSAQLANLIGTISNSSLLKISLAIIIK